MPAHASRHDQRRAEQRLVCRARKKELDDGAGQAEAIREGE